MSPDQHRKDAQKFCDEWLDNLCKEVVAWVDVGVIGDAPLFRQLSEKCKLFAGVEYGRTCAENMVRVTAMRRIASGVDKTAKV